jgi:hypothetical protein
MQGTGYMSMSINPLKKRDQKIENGMSEIQYVISIYHSFFEETPRRTTIDKNKPNKANIPMGSGKSKEATENPPS